ncbi:MAG: hypothetical protein SGPRY_012534, partial [Prymnesium sp.]
LQIRKLDSKRRRSGEHSRLIRKLVNFCELTPKAQAAKVTSWALTASALRTALHLFYIQKVNREAQPGKRFHAHKGPGTPRGTAFSNAHGVPAEPAAVMASMENWTRVFWRWR